MLYFIHGSFAFPKSNEREMHAVFGAYTILAKSINLYIIRARNIDLKSAKNTMFIYRILKLQWHGPIDESDYLGSIKTVLESSKITKKRMKIECVDVLSRRDHSAKDIEVYLGENLEKKGANIDIKTPEVLYYIILFKMNCYIGSMPYSKLRFVDPGRHYKELSLGISRAEFKIMQAFDEFNITPKNGTALDLGAAPGGWSAHLARKGMKVIAVDKGLLDYDRFTSLGISMCIIEDMQINEDVNGFDVINIKSLFDDVLLGKIKFSMITCDMNVSPEETSKAIIKFSKSIKKGGAVIATIKCTTRNVGNYVKIAKDALEKEFTINRVKVLPSNRQEATLFAVKK